MHAFTVLRDIPAFRNRYYTFRYIFFGLLFSRRPAAHIITHDK